MRRLRPGWHQKHFLYFVFFKNKVSCDASGQLNTQNIYMIFYIFEKECRAMWAVD